MVWVAAGIRIVTGSGFYIQAITCLVLLMVSVELLPAMIQRLGVRKLRMKEITLRLMIPQPDEIQNTIATIEDHHIRVTHVRIKDLKDGSFAVTLRLRVNEKRQTEASHQEISLLHHTHNLGVRGKTYRLEKR